MLTPAHAHVRTHPCTLALVVSLIGMTACAPEECATAADHTGDLILLRQADLDAIEVEPLVGTVTGFLRVMEVNGAITDLSPLRCLAIVDGAADVIQTQNLVSLAGLEQLKRVGGQLNINAHSALTDVALPSLVEVGGDLVFDNNTAFEGALELPALHSVGDDVSVLNNPLLVSFSLPRLTSTDELKVRTNEELRDVSLPRLESASDGVDLFANPNLERVDLSSLREVDGRPLNIEQNMKLDELRLDALESLTRGLRLITNEGLSTLDLPLLHTALREVTIRDTYRLLRVSMPLAAVDPVTDVVVEDNGLLGEIQLPRVAFVRSVRIARNKSLETLDLTGLFHVATLEILENPALENLDLVQLTGITPNGTTPGILHIESNVTLSELNIDALTNLDHRMTIVGNYELNACDMVGHALRLGMIDPFLVTIQDNDDTGAASGLHVENQEELDAHAGTRCVRGSVTLGEPTPDAIFPFDNFEALADLESVFGAVSLLGVESGSAVEMPRLRRVGGSVSVSGLGLTGDGGEAALALESLERAGGLILSRHPGFVWLKAPLLRDITGGMLISHMELLSALDMPEIRTIEGGLTAHCNPSLDESELRRIVELAAVQYQSLCGGPGLEVCVQAIHETTCS